MKNIGISDIYKFLTTCDDICTMRKLREQSATYKRQNDEIAHRKEIIDEHARVITRLENEVDSLRGDLSEAKILIRRRDDDVANAQEALTKISEITFKELQREPHDNRPNKHRKSEIGDIIRRADRGW